MEKQYFQSANVFIHHNTIDVKMTFCGGENDLKKSGEIINLTTIYTRYNGKCYAISTTRNIDERETEVKIWSRGYYQGWYLRGFKLDVFFTSDGV